MDTQFRPVVGVLKVHDSKLSVAVISDCTIFRDSIERCINSHIDMAVAIATGDIAYAERQFSMLAVSVAVIDLDHSSRQALQLASRFTTSDTQTRLVFLAGATTVSLVRCVLRMNASYLTKTEPAQSIIDAIRSAAQGQPTYSAEFQNWLAYNNRRRRFEVADSVAEKQLTERELVILKRIACGDSNKEVARALRLTPKSVENHSSRIRKKLNVHDRVQLCRYAIRHGLVNP